MTTTLLSIVHTKDEQELLKVKKADLVCAVLHLRRRLRELRDINNQQVVRLVEQELLRMRIAELEAAAKKP